MPHTPYSCTHKPRTHLGATSTQVIDHTYRSKRSATSPQRQQQHSDCARPCPTRAAPTALDSHLHCHASSMLRHSHHTGTPSDRRNRRREAAKRKRLAATTAAVTSSMRTAQPARDCQARARDTRHARGRPRTHGLRSHQRCRAPAGRNADRVDVEALDVAPSRTRHCTLKSKEPASQACQPVKE